MKKSYKPILPILLDSQHSNFFTNRDSIPFFFTEKYFFNWVNEKLRLNQLSISKPATDPKHVEPISFTSANKVSYHRRTLQIPHPEHYLWTAQITTELLQKSKKSILQNSCISLTMKLDEDSVVAERKGVISEKIFNPV